MKIVFFVHQSWFTTELQTPNFLVRNGQRVLAFFSQEKLVWNKSFT